ncbi:MAG: hypothetical protein V9F82_06525 [Dermatophilaceae bacterium]
MSIFADALEALSATDLQPVGRLAGVADADRLGTPSNAQILAACQKAYAAHQPAVDACTTSSNTWAAGPGRSTGNIATIRSQQGSYNDKQLGAAQVAQTQGVFQANGDPQDCSGIFGPAMCNVNADHLFSTIGLGMSVSADVIVGGAGGLGCAWDIAGREGPKGYGYLQGEIGLAIDVAVNIECVIYNQLPSALSFTTLGLVVEVGYGLGARLAVITDTSLDLRGFAIGIGANAGAGALVFGGHIWNFG